MMGLVALLSCTGQTWASRFGSTKASASRRRRQSRISLAFAHPSFSSILHPSFSIVLWVATEECNVSLNPSHRLLLVFEAQISCQISRVLHGEKTKQPQSVVDGDEDNILVEQVLWIRESVGITLCKGPPVDPEQNRFQVWVCWVRSEDV